MVDQEAIDKAVIAALVSIGQLRIDGEEYKSFADAL